jgi:hypothetical protein
MPSTYTPIATTTLGSTQASVSFSSFSGYTDIKLVMNARTSDGSGYFNIYPNNDGSSLYSRTYLYGNGSAAGSGRTSNSTTGLQMNCATSSQDVNSYPVSADFMSYGSGSVNKTILVRAGSTDVALVESWVWLYRNLSAISSIVISANTTTFTAGSTFTLYGITAA